MTWLDCLKKSIVPSDVFARLYWKFGATIREIVEITVELEDKELYIYLGHAPRDWGEGEKGGGATKMCESAEFAYSRREFFINHTEEWANVWASGFLYHYDNAMYKVRTQWMNEYCRRAQRRRPLAAFALLEVSINQALPWLHEREQELYTTVPITAGECASPVLCTAWRPSPQLYSETLLNTYIWGRRTYTNLYCKILYTRIPPSRRPSYLHPIMRNKLRLNPVNARKTRAPISWNFPSLVTRNVAVVSFAQRPSQVPEIFSLAGLHSHKKKFPKCTVTLLKSFCGIQYCVRVSSTYLKHEKKYFWLAELFKGFV